MEEFIKTITEQLRYEKVRGRVAKELSDHISDQAQAYEACGEEHEKALARAIREMGDPVEIGVALDRVHRPQTDWRMLGMAFAFSILGFILLCTAGGLSAYYSVARQCFFTILGLGVMTGIYFLDYSFIGKYGLAVYFVWTAVFLLWSFMGERHNGRVEPLQMVSYLYAPIFAGALYRIRGEGYAAVCKGIALLFLTALLVMRCASSVPAAANLYLIGSVLLSLSLWDGRFRIGRRQAIALMILLLVVIPMLAIGGVFCFGASYQAMRLRALLNPQAYAGGAGYLYNIIRENLACARWIGGLPVDESSVGVTFGQTTFLPFQLMIRYGLLAGLGLALALVLLLARAARVTVRQKNRLGRTVAASCAMVLFVNSIEGLLLNVGLYPIITVALPFLSHGGAATLTYAAMIGLLLSVYRHERLVSDETGIHTSTSQPSFRIRIPETSDKDSGASNNSSMV
ncbi:MAG: FtsW/RodA/SpoVE family cell cycle protein [Roseburia sp.]|nr:FtsW/RodA/SpoVE family cell cycle protein [Roseburia sp.]